MADNEITIELSAAQQKLLLTLVDEIGDEDNGVVDKVHKIVKKGSSYELVLITEELEWLCEMLADVGNQEDDAKKQNKIFDLVDYLEDTLFDNTEEADDLDTDDDDEEEEDWDDDEEEEWEDDEED